MEARAQMATQGCINKNIHTVENGTRQRSIRVSKPIQNPTQSSSKHLPGRWNIQVINPTLKIKVMNPTHHHTNLTTPTVTLHTSNSTQTKPVQINLITNLNLNRVLNQLLMRTIMQSQRHCLKKKKAEEIESDEERVQTDEKSMITPPDNGTPKEILEEACVESQSNEEAIECGEEIDNTPLYLQPSIVHALEEKVEEFTFVVNEESTLEEMLPPVIDKLEGCSYEEEGPEWKEERTRRKAASAIY